MIPKMIHYCWFGGNPLPESTKKYIRTWKQFLPDYKITEWNETNFDIQSAPAYVREAYEAKKYAFVSDYVRVQKLLQYGGIYFDTDVEVVRPFEQYLQGHSMVAGFLAGYMESKDLNHAFKMGLCAGSASAYSDHLARKEEIEALYKTL